MKNRLFTGSGVALITPFKKDLSVDFEALGALIEAQIAGGADALITCGTTGEPSTLSADEWAAVVSFTVRQTRRRVPVIAGTGGNNTSDVLLKARRAFELGADGQLCVTPYYNKTSQNGLVAHFNTVADDGSLPVIMYNVPGRTGLSMSLAAAKKLSLNPRIVGIKEATGDAAFALDLIAECGGDLPLYSGADELTCQLRVIGGVGCISVLSNAVPESAATIAKADLETAAREQTRLIKFVRCLFKEVNPIPIKAAMNFMGLCENVLRLPLVPMSRENAEILKAEMRRVGLI